jgi:hypothetical protein
MGLKQAEKTLADRHGRISQALFASVRGPYSSNPSSVY